MRNWRFGIAIALFSGMKQLQKPTGVLVGLADCVIMVQAKRLITDPLNNVRPQG